MERAPSPRCRAPSVSRSAHGTSDLRRSRRRCADVGTRNPPAAACCRSGVVPTRPRARPSEFGEDGRRVFDFSARRRRAQEAVHTPSPARRWRQPRSTSQLPRLREVRLAHVEVLRREQRQRRSPIARPWESACRLEHEVRARRKIMRRRRSRSNHEDRAVAGLFCMRSS